MLTGRKASPKVRFFAVVTALVLLMAVISAIFTAPFGVSFGITASAAEPDGALKYVALGDSVPAGYALPSPETDNYAYLLSEKLKAAGDYALINLAQSGITSTQLLAALTGEGELFPDGAVALPSDGTASDGAGNFSGVPASVDTPALLDALRGAQIITVNIGGNNVLQPFLGILAETLMPFGDISNLDSAKLLEILGTLTGVTITVEQMELLNTGVEAFASDFPKIIEILKAAAPEAVIVVSTIYNPLPDFLPLSGVADRLIPAMNAVIESSNAVYGDAYGNVYGGGYIIADVYAAFKAATVPVTNVNLNPFAGIFSVDIHPNAAGHALMAELHEGLLLAELAERSLNDEQFIEALYRDLLGRAPDRFGRAAWLERLACGMSRDDVRRGFLVSEEYLARLR